MKDNKKIKKKELLAKIEVLEKEVDYLKSNDVFYMKILNNMAGSERSKTTYTMQQTSNKPIA